MGSWKLGVEPEGFEVERRDSEFAVLMMMAGDGDLARELQPDIDEMLKGAAGEIGVLALVDTPGETGVRVVEIRSDGFYELEGWPEISTGDPRPLADFLARGLVSFSKETRFAIGFWGHGSGVFGDYDTQERVIDREFRFGPLGEPIPAEAAFKVVLEPKEALSRSMMPDMTSENSLTNREASSALAVAFSRAKRTRKVDMVFFDTCLNGSVEVFTEVRPFAEAVVASQLPIPGTGWHYGYWLYGTRKEKPKDFRVWADVAVSAYDAAYDQKNGAPPAQLMAFSTDPELDFVAAFGDLVKALDERDCLSLVGKSAPLVQAIHYGENVDFCQLVEKILELADDEELKALASRFLEVYREAVIVMSTPPPSGERLSGMTLWCPYLGDREKVVRYYEGLEFDRLTGWSRLLLEPSTEENPSSGEGLTMFGVWGVKLVEAMTVDKIGVSGQEEGEERILWVGISPECAEYAGGLVEGRYSFDGGTGSMELKSYVGMREFYRKLKGMREEDDEFAELEGATLDGYHRPSKGWVLGTAVCAKLVKDFLRYQERFLETYPYEAKLFMCMKVLVIGASKDGLVMFV